MYCLIPVTRASLCTLNLLETMAATGLRVWSFTSPKLINQICDPVLIVIKALRQIVDRGNANGGYDSILPIRSSGTELRPFQTVFIYFF